jgi:8-oxo-dGTP diphosphatase
MKQIRAVGAVVYRARAGGSLDILLIRKAQGDWSLPKGKLRRGEDEIAAVLREVYEETGVEGVVQELVGEAVYRVVKPAGLRRKTVTYYLVLAIGGELCPDVGEQIVGVRWFALPQALRRLRRPRLRTLLRAAQTLLSPGALG